MAKPTALMTSRVPQRGATAKLKSSPMMITSTAHLTGGEAQALTDHGYSRWEYGWLLYVGQPGEPVLTEIEPVSAGLAEVIRRARQECCHYVLLDRDAGILPDAATYDW